MKIGVLAQVLGTEAEGLTRAHNLENVEELTEEQTATILRAEIEEIRKGVHSKAKQEGHGWGSKEALTNAEKTLASELGLKASTFKEMVAEAKELITKAPEGKPDDKILLQLESWKEKYKQKETELEKFKIGIETEKKMVKANTVIQKIIQENFDTSSERLMGLALSDFHAKYDIEVDTEREAVNLYTKDGKAVFQGSDEVIKTHFTDLLPGKKQEDPKPPRLPNPKGPTHIPKGDTVETLTMELHQAKTPDARASILAKINELSNN